MLQSTLIRERTLSADRLMSYSPWSAAFAGALVATAIQITLTVLGAALGVTAMPDAVRSDTAAGAGAWWFVTGIISLAAGGAMTGYLHPSASGCIRAINGFMAWCLVNVFGALMIVIGGSALLGSSLATIVPASIGPWSARVTPTEAIELSEPIRIASSTLWLTFLALLLGSAAAWIASWWVGGLFSGERVTVEFRQVPRSVPPMPGAPVG
ncbi:MAG: hypothetical protein JNL80_04985 [Phycisphaerae bacterium]|nr:hypothetical protein [Phycisphaerae bacterium]